jgi:hypothetical protein
MDAFQRSFAVGGPINPKTGSPFGSSTKAWAEWAVQQGGKEVLTNEQYELVMHMAAGVKLNSFAQELLDGGIAEGVVRADYCGKRCQIRLDWVESTRRHRRSEDLRRPAVVRVGRKAVLLPPPSFVLSRSSSAGAWRCDAGVLHRSREKRTISLRRLAGCGGFPRLGATRERSGD